VSLENIEEEKKRRTVHHPPFAPGNTGPCSCHGFSRRRCARAAEPQFPCYRTRRCRLAATQARLCRVIFEVLDCDLSNLFAPF